MSLSKSQEKLVPNDLAYQACQRTTRKEPVAALLQILISPS